jgi:RNase P/RNase MRP subunit POP5
MHLKKAGNFCVSLVFNYQLLKDILYSLNVLWISLIRYPSIMLGIVHCVRYTERKVSASLSFVTFRL